MWLRYLRTNCARRGRLGGWSLTLAIAVLAALASGGSARAISEVNPPLQKLAEEQEPRLASHLGFSLSKLHLVVGYTTEPAEDPHADTITLSRENGPFSLHGPVCQVAVNKTWWGARTHYEMEEVLVHEVFHCFEHQIEPNMSREAGSTNLALIQDCEYDVLLSGKTGYAAGDALAQSVSEPGPPARAANAPGATGSGSTTPSSGGPAPSKPSPPPAIDLGAGGAQPALAYDPKSGDTYVAWEDPELHNVVDLCVVPAGGNACNGGSGPYKLIDPLAGPGAAIFGFKIVVMPGGDVVVVANIAGAGEKVRPAGYTEDGGVVAWSSPAGGEAFGKPGQGIANEGGKLLAENRGEMPDEGALALDATHILVYGNSHPFGSGATVFTLTSSAPNKTPLVDHTEEFGDQELADGSQLAAEEYPAKSGEYVVVTAGSDLGTPKGCPAGSEEGTGYGVAKGTPKKLQEHPAWNVGYFKLVSCQAKAAVLTGGGAGTPTSNPGSGSQEYLAPSL